MYILSKYTSLPQTMHFHDGVNLCVGKGNEVAKTTQVTFMLHVPSIFGNRNYSIIIPCIKLLHARHHILRLPGGGNFNYIKCFFWHTVGGRNPAPVDLVNIPYYLQGFIIPGGAGFLPSTVVVVHIASIGITFAIYKKNMSIYILYVLIWLHPFGHRTLAHKNTKLPKVQKSKTFFCILICVNEKTT